MVELQPIFRKAYWTLVAGGLAYVLFVTALTFPGVQRLYDTLLRGMNRLANLVQHPLCKQGQSCILAGCQPGRTVWLLEYVIWNISKNSILIKLGTQVQPFHLVTPDNETLYGWHLLPLHLCREHEKELLENPPSGPAEDYTQTLAHKILAGDPNARVVVSCMSSTKFLSSQKPRLIFECCSPRECGPSRVCPKTSHLQYTAWSFHPIASRACLCH